MFHSSSVKHKYLESLLFKWRFQVFTLIPVYCLGQDEQLHEGDQILAIDGQVDQGFCC